MKKVLIALLCVLLALCFVSCGGNEAGGNPAGSGSGSGSGSGNPLGAVLDTDFELDSNGEGFSFAIYYESGYVAGIECDVEESVLSFVIVYSNISEAIPDNYFDKAMIQGAQTDITNPMTQFGMLGFFVGTTEAGGLDQYLSSSSIWYIDLTSETDPSRNVTITVPAQYVTQIKAFINNWTPSPAGE